MARKANEKPGPKMGKPKLRVVGSGEPKRPDLPPNEREYFADLHKIVDDIYTEAADEFKWTWNQLAAHSNLSYATVANLGDRVTKYPRFSTIHKLAAAVGWKLIMKAAAQRRHASTAKMAAS